MVRRPIALIAVACALGCAGAPEPSSVGWADERPPALACPDRVCAIARVDAEAGVVEVRLHIEPGALPSDRRDVQLRFRARYFGDDYAARFVEVQGGPGWPESLGAVTAPTELYYRVSLDYHERGEAPHGRGGTSWRRPGGWHLTGKTFLPDVWVDGVAIDAPATLVLDVGDEVLWTAGGTEQRRFDADSLTRLADESYEVGPMQVTRREIGGTTLWFGHTDADDPRLELAADELARAFSILSLHLGPPPSGSVLFVLHPVSEGEPDWGERLGSSLVQVSAAGLPQDLLYGLAVSIHELAHLWLPGSHVIAEDWLEEGLADYLAILVAEELVGSAERDRIVLRRHAAYAADAEQRTMRDPHPTNGRWLYDAGLVAGYCLDTHLARSHSSLTSLLRTTLARDAVELGTETLIEDLRARSPEAASYLATLAETRGPVPIDECLARRGLRVVDVDFASFSDRTLAVEVLGLRGLSTLSKLEAFVVEDVGADGLLVRGDVVLRVASRPVANLADVAYALQGLDPGDSFSIELRRDGEPLTLTALVPGLTDPSRPSRRYRALVPLAEQEQ